MPEATQVLHVYPAPVVGGEIFDLGRLRVPLTALQFDDRVHILICQRGRSIHFCFSGNLQTLRRSLLATVLAAPGCLKNHLLLIRRLNDVYMHGKFRPALFPPDNRSRRLRQVLTALDGRLACRTDREIAIELFGEQRVMADWNDPGGWLRDRVRRAVNRGLFLMSGGYRTLLP